MADDADIAGDRAEFELAARLAGVCGADVPAGVSGECDDCGEHMPRLVGGRCAFCRDGRRPPLAVYDRIMPSSETRAPRAVLPEAVDPTPRHNASPVPITPPAKETSVANPKPSEHRQQISVPAEGRSLHVIRERADMLDLPLGRAALSIIDDWIANQDAGEWGEVPVLGAVTLEALMAELGLRVSTATPEELAAANERAAAAERKLAAVTAALGAGA